MKSFNYQEYFDNLKVGELVEVDEPSRGLGIYLVYHVYDSITMQRHVLHYAHLERIDGNEV